MCKHGTTEVLGITIPAEHSHTGKSYRKLIEVDACIAPLVKLLNETGLVTRASCCGHGQLPPSIVLMDGRELRLLSQSQSAALDALIGRDIHGRSML